MSRWLVKLEGEMFDLEEFPRWFPNGDAYAAEIDGSVYLLGPSFERLPDQVAVYHAALQVLDEFFAVISLLQSNLRRPRLDSVFRELDDGSRQQHAFGGGVAVCRSKARGSVSVAGEEDVPRPTQAQALLGGLSVNRHLDTAVSLWADPLRTWPRLYRIMEEIEEYLSENVGKAGLCSRNERERFTRSANHPDVAGRDARHARGTEIPNNPMTLVAASAFVANLLRLTLSSAVSTDCHRPGTH